LLAKVAIPILGLDFFRKFHLSIHPLQCQVMDKTGQPISAIFAAAAAADKPPQQEVRILPSLLTVLPSLSLFSAVFAKLFIC
jgi:hypothetical protein